MAEWDALMDAPLKRAESIPPNDVHASIDPGPEDCAERPECALSFADLARMRVEAGELPPQKSYWSEETREAEMRVAVDKGKYDIKTAMASEERPLP